MDTASGTAAPAASSSPFRETGGKVGTADSSSRPYRELAEVDWSVPTAVLFGNEVAGVSMEALAAADSCCYIGTTGFVQSLNVSVAAAIVFSHCAASVNGSGSTARSGKSEMLTRSVAELSSRALVSRGWSEADLVEAVEAL